MSQRVNIQYSIDLEELPSEVDRLSNKCYNELERSLAASEGILQTNMVSVDGLNKISDLRLSLAKADHILDDLSKIITGYLRMAVVPQREMPEYPQEVQTQGSPFDQKVVDPTTIQELQNKLSNFKEMVDNENSTQASTEQE